jgi:acetoin:2,6-dichlorophenolindophenol oxidoreductase subunit alpha
MRSATSIEIESLAAMPPAWRLDQWRTMVRIRRTEEMIADMVERGTVRCPCHLYIGQEAVATGVCAALDREDTVWGGHRSHGHYIAKGGSAEALFAEILGKSNGCSGGRGGSMHLLAAEIGILGTAPIVAGTIPIAAGAALAAKMQATDSQRVAVAFFGDGALEEGHVHETLNLAAVYRLPIIFVCENNLYSSHLHWRERRVADNLDQAGAFHSVPGERVDGNDVEAVYDAARRAVERARAGAGPSLLECRTFRWRGHVGASLDLDVGLHRRDELSEWIERDPIQLCGERLAGIADLESERIAIDRELGEALKRAKSDYVAPPARVLEHVFAGTHSQGAPCES